MIEKKMREFTVEELDEALDEHIETMELAIALGKGESSTEEYVFVSGLFRLARDFADIECMSRSELLAEYEYELNMRALEADPWVTRGRRRLINEVSHMRGEREADLSELMSMSRAELMSLAKGAGVEHIGRWTKAQLADVLLVRN